jgi:hypothetical protein
MPAEATESHDAPFQHADLPGPLAGSPGRRRLVPAAGARAARVPPLRREQPGGAQLPGHDRLGAGRTAHHSRRLAAALLGHGGLPRRGVHHPRGRPAPRHRTRQQRHGPAPLPLLPRRGAQAHARGGRAAQPTGHAPPDPAGRQLRDRIAGRSRHPTVAGQPLAHPARGRAARADHLPLLARRRRHGRRPGEEGPAVRLVAHRDGDPRRAGPGRRCAGPASRHLR